MESVATQLDRARYQDAQRIQQVGSAPALDPGMLQASQSAVERDIDGLRQARAERGSLGAQYESPRTRNLAENLRAIRRVSRVKDEKGNLAKAATNKAYTQIVNTWQSSLLASTLALEIFISPWVFLVLFGMRVMASVMPMRLRGIDIIPPYTLKGGGVGVLISHLGGALLILLVLTVIITLVSLVVFFFTQSVWEQLKLIFDLGATGLQVLFDLVTA